MVATKNRLFDQVVAVTHEYLGPAADRFIARQVVNHLQKTPESLQSQDMPALIDWLKLSMAFLTEDTMLIERYVDELKSLTVSKKPSTTRAERPIAHGKRKV